MQLSGVFLKLGEAGFYELIRGISIGKLKTYQIYDGFKTRAHLAKLNTETLRKAGPRLWKRLGEQDEEFARDLAQTVLVSHLQMIAAVLDEIGIPHDQGFFNKDVDARKHLTEGWESRVYERFKDTYPRGVLLFYIHHLSWELTPEAEPFSPEA